MKAVSFYTQLTPKNKEKLDLFSKMSGIKKNFIINKALEIFFNTQMNIPKEHIIEPFLYVDENEFEKIKNMNDEPNDKLRELLKNVN